MFSKTKWKVCSAGEKIIFDETGRSFVLIPVSWVVHFYDA